jgi:hypothetical protein
VAILLDALTHEEPRIRRAAADNLAAVLWRHRRILQDREIAKAFGWPSTGVDLPPDTQLPMAFDSDVRLARVTKEWKIDAGEEAAAIARLKQLLGDQREDVRLGAVRILGSFLRTEGVLPALKQALRDHAPQVRAAAVTAISENNPILNPLSIGERCRLLLDAMLDDSDSCVRIVAARHLDLLIRKYYTKDPAKLWPDVSNESKRLADYVRRNTDVSKMTADQVLATKLLQLLREAQAPPP